MDYKKTTLPNGLRIITVPMQGTNTATVLVMVGTGSKYEEKQENGISHFLEHMVFKGTEKRPSALQISTEIDSIGGILNAFTGFEYTGYWTKVNASNIEIAIDLVADISKNSLLQEEEIEREKGVIIEEINMIDDEPADKVEYVFYKLLYGDQPAGWEIPGPKDVINKITRDDFIRYKSEHYTAPNTVAVIAGNIKPEFAEEKIAAMLEGISQREAKEKVETKEDRNRPKILLYNKETSQSHFLLGGYSYKLSDERKSAANVLFKILGSGMSSRLWISIRERNGLAYNVQAFSDPSTDSGIYAIYAGVDHNKAEKAIGLSLQELDKIKKEKVPEDELKKAKEIIKGRASIKLESSSEVANWCAHQELLENKILTPEEYFAKIDAVTAEQVQDAANDLFTNDNLKLAMIGPHKNGNEFEKLLKI